MIAIAGERALTAAGRWPLPCPPALVRGGRAAIVRLSKVARKSSKSGSPARVPVRAMPAAVAAAAACTAASARRQCCVVLGDVHHSATQRCSWPPSPPQSLPPLPALRSASPRSVPHASPRNGLFGSLAQLLLVLQRLLVHIAVDGLDEQGDERRQAVGRHVVRRS